MRYPITATPPYIKTQKKTAQKDEVKACENRRQVQCEPNLNNKVVYHIRSALLNFVLSAIEW